MESNNYVIGNDQNNFTLNELFNDCKMSDDDILPFLIKFEQNNSNNIIKEINKGTFKNISNIYELVLLYHEDLKYLKELEFFEKSRQWLVELLKIREYDKYINFLFFIKLYQYYLKIKIRNIILFEYLIQYRLKYTKEDYVERIKTKDIELLLGNESNNSLLEHYLYELMMKEYSEKKKITYNNLKDDETLEQEALDSFIQNDNIEWIKNYWKYITKTEIYKEMCKEIFMDWLPYTYLKHKVQIDPIISEAYYIEDIRNDNDFIFNRVNKIKHVKIYKLGYTNSILKEIDYILQHISNKELLEKKYNNLSQLYNIYYYKTLLNIDYYTINLFKPIHGNKFENKVIHLKKESLNHKIKCPFRKKNKYYISEKYEIPFTTLNDTYKSNPDEYIIRLVDETKYFVNLILLNLKKKTVIKRKATDKNKKKKKKKNQNISNLNKLYTDILNNIEKNVFEGREYSKFTDNSSLFSSLNSNNEYHFINDEFFRYFIIKFVKFISLPKIIHLLSTKFNYDNNNINFYLDGMDDKMKKKSFLYKEKVILENLLKIYILFFFNLRNKENIVHLKSLIQFLKEKWSFLNKSLCYDHFFNILNSFESSKYISKILYIDNENAYVHYDTIIRICLEDHMAIRKFNETSYELDVIDAKEIYTNNLNYFYFDFSLLRELYISCQKNEKEDELINENGNETTDNNIIDLSLINHILQNNINLFFSYIYNSFGNIFKNDFTCSVNYNLSRINEDASFNFREIFYQYNDFDIGDYDIDENEYTYLDDNTDNNSTVYNDFLNFFDIYNNCNQKVKFFSRRFKFFKELFNNKNAICNYEIFFKYLTMILKKFDETYTEIFEDEHNNIKKQIETEVDSINLEDGKIYVKGDRIINNCIFINFSNHYFDIPNTISSNFLNRKEFKEINENMVLRNKLYVMLRLFKWSNIYSNDTSDFIYRKTRCLFYKRYPSTYYRKSNIVQFNYYQYSKKFEKCKNNEMDFLIKTINKRNKSYKIPSLNISIKYSKNYMKFIESIIKLYDYKVNYKYKNIRIIHNSSDGLIDLGESISHSFNIKLTYKEWFEIKNSNKEFFLLTLGIYLLNSEYSTNYIYNSMNNFNYCQYKDSLKGYPLKYVRWLKWINYKVYFNDIYIYDNKEIKIQEKRTINNTRDMENLLYLNLKDFFNFDSYTNINQLLLPSFFYFLNENNINNTYFQKFL